MYCRVTDQIFGIIRLLDEENKKPKDYGTGALLSHTEVSFLETVARYPEGNVSALSERLGITKGATTQMTGKLFQKDLLETIQRDDNKKEKFFRLTKNGEATISAYRRFHKEANRKLCDYIAALNPEEADTVFRFLEHLKQCVPFCEFQCECKNGNRNEKEGNYGQATTAECTRITCRA